MEWKRRETQKRKKREGEQEGEMEDEQPDEDWDGFRDRWELTEGIGEGEERMDGGQARDGFSFGGLERGKRRGMMVRSTVVSQGRQFNKTSYLFTRLWIICYPLSKHIPQTVMVNGMEIYHLDCDFTALTNCACSVKMMSQCLKYTISPLHSMNLQQITLWRIRSHPEPQQSD